MRPLVAVAAITFASFGVAAAAHVAKRGPDLYARAAVFEIVLSPPDKLPEDALAFLKKFGRRAAPAIASRAREAPIPDELFSILAASAGEEEIDLLSASVVGTTEGRRKDALGALARIHTEAAARAAGPALADPSPEVRNAAREALRGHPESIFSAAVTDAMGAASFAPDFIAAVLVDEGLVAAAVAPVSAGLRSGEPIRIYNALYLARATFPQFPPGAGREASLAQSIVTALPRFEPGAQLLAIEVLAALSGPEALKALCEVAAATNRSSAIRLLAIESLGGRQDPRAIAALEALVRKERREIRTAAADALGKTASGKDASRWLSQIERGEVDLEGREALLRAIAASGDGALATRLIALIHKIDSPTLHETLHSVVARDPKAGIPALIDDLLTTPPNELPWIDAELRLLTGHLSRRVGAFRTREDIERERAALHKDWAFWWGLNKTKEPDEWRASAQQEAEEGLRSPRASDRAMAVARIARLAPADLEARLVPLLDDPEEQVWGRLQEALSSKLSPSGNEMIRGRLLSGTPREQWRAARLLGIRGDVASADALLESLSSQEAAVRREAARSLGRLSEQRAAKPLLPLLRDRTGDVRDAARDSLADLKNRSVEPDLLEGLKSADADYRVSCVQLLGRCGTKAAVRPLASFFHDQSQIAQQSALHSFQSLVGIVPSVLDPSESDLRKWEEMVERRQR
ncbi:MAG: HEAT repeat domain-containing protein [Planctomycetota bacterium]